MISRIRHVAFVVRDIEHSLKFYRDILGLKIYKRMIENDNFISKLTGIKEVKLEWVKLIIPEGGLIELIQYHSHVDNNEKVKIFNSNKIGCSHVALTVNNLEILYDKLIKNNFLCKSSPLISPDGKAKVLYCGDPDGGIIELIEDIS